MQNRRQHQQEVQAFLQHHFPGAAWEFSLPRGSGNETYFCQSHLFKCFVKLGVQAVRYQAAAATGLTPEVLASGRLEDGTSIIVQAFVMGRSPSRSDYRLHLDQFAGAIRRLHDDPALKKLLPPVRSEQYRQAGLDELERIRQKWEVHQAQVPGSARFVEEGLRQLRQAALGFKGTGLAASHNDINNTNWLITAAGRLYLVDLDSMSLDDPALDVGATLWWYYPPGLREAFLSAAGYDQEAGFKLRMRVRMALHCLNIRLPRPGSFDRFDPAGFDQALDDFRAALAGEENPQGYENP
jgi:thiamine kinase-like enzyme